MNETYSINKAALEYIHSFMENNGQDFLFHNYDYVVDVVNTFKEISKNSGLDKKETEIARLVAAFKDVGIVNSEDPSLDNQTIIESFFNEVNLSPENREHFNQLMDFARSKRSPENKLEAALIDSVNIQLAYPGGLEKLNLLRLERESLYHQTYDDLKWLEICKRYFIRHTFSTRYAKEKFGNQRYKNFLEIDRLLYKIKSDREKQNKSSVFEGTDGSLSFKESEDLFKIAFRNYVDLVSVADRKAGLMINVNSIIISVVIAFALRHVDTHPMIIVPTIVILIVALATIYLAIQASRPQEKMQNDPLINGDEVFFFGSFDRVDNHFIKMPWGQYKNSLQNLVNGTKGEIIQQITEETFIVRKVLAQKFRYISMAFKIFSFGLMATILSFLVFYLLSV
jgi:hypothetical protein